MSEPKRLINTLVNQEADRRPVWMMRQAGRYLPEYKATRQKAGSFLDLCYAPALAEEVTLQPLRRFDFDAAILFADILLIPHGLGQDVSFKEGEGPVLDPVRDAAACAKLSLSGVREHLSPIFETVDRLSGSLPKDVTLIGFCGAPWTVATYMVEGGTSRDRKLAKIAAWSGLADANHWFNRLMDLLVESSIDYLKQQVAAGAEVLQVFETWASDLPDVLFDKYCIEPMKRIFDGVRAEYPDVPMIGFPRGGGQFVSSFCDQVRPDGLGCDWGMDMQLIDSLTGKKQVLQGNLDPLCLLHGGEVLEQGVMSIVENTQPGRHIFNLGHGILPETPIEHVEQMLTALRAAEMRSI